MPEFNTIVLQDDTNSQLLEFEINRRFDNVDLSKKTIEFIFENAIGEKGSFIASNLSVSEDTINFCWLLTNEITKYQGEIKAAINIIGYLENDLNYKWQSLPFTFEINQNLQSGDDEIEVNFPYVLSQMKVEINDIQNRVTNLEENISNVGETTDIITSIVEMQTKLIDLEDKKHIHDNKEIIDNISQEDINNWNTVTDGSMTKLLFLDNENNVPILTTSMLTQDGIIFPMTYIAANPGTWTEVFDIKTKSNIDDIEMQFIPGNHFSAKLWLLSEMQRDNVQIRLQAIDTNNGDVLISATSKINLLSDGVTPIPVSFDNIHQVLRVVPLSQIRFSLSIMPVLFAVQIGAISRIPNEISFINVAATTGANTTDINELTNRIDILESELQQIKDIVENFNK